MKTLDTSKNIVLDINEINRMLPHSYPFLLVDRVTNIELGVAIEGLKNISMNEPQFTGHFPERPIMPGVMIIEAMAQVSGILAMKSLQNEGGNNIFFLASVDNAKFKKVVIPGDQLILKSQVDKKKNKIWKFSCTSYVGNDLVCSASIMIAKD
jgi:3-hydroxyacyl-[acyl-carrier-protein] dehydratase